ncbi:MAG: hypothetical protein R3E08_11815 [Thiotrichaceae bacterium]
MAVVFITMAMPQYLMGSTLSNNPALSGGGGGAIFNTGQER